MADTTYIEGHLDDIEGQLGLLKEALLAHVATTFSEKPPEWWYADGHGAKPEPLLQQKQEPPEDVREVYETYCQVHWGDAPKSVLPPDDDPRLIEAITLFHTNRAIHEANVRARVRAEFHTSIRWRAWAARMLFEEVLR